MPQADRDQNYHQAQDNDAGRDILPLADKINNEPIMKAVENLSVQQALKESFENTDVLPIEQAPEPEKDSNKETKEKIYAQNTKRLKKRFGESFIEDSGGRNARSLGFFDQPDFADPAVQDWLKQQFPEVESIVVDRVNIMLYDLQRALDQSSSAEPRKNT